jgi:GAF domain-containing protein
MKAPLPSKEAERLRALHLYKVLDTSADDMLDNLTQLAATICETPISLISLVDKDRQWFKSKFGLDVDETPRDYSFCAHAILQNGVFQVPDAREDERFADNPLVTGKPGIQFYAGAPLVVSDGVNLGALCVIDSKPRVLTENQQKAMVVLSRAVVAQLELRRALEDLESMQQFLPMCAWCRSIRQPDGDWKTLQQFVEHATKVTHSICPVCAKAMRDEAR